jgi:hypothetical protein
MEPNKLVLAPSLSCLYSHARDASDNQRKQRDPGVGTEKIFCLTTLDSEDSKGPPQ